MDDEAPSLGEHVKEIRERIEEPKHPAGSPSATSSDETVSPARRSPDPAVQTVTGATRRPRKRRSRRRSSKGVAKGSLGPRPVWRVSKASGKPWGGSGELAIVTT
jgi:hypothetical protein